MLPACVQCCTRARVNHGTASAVLCVAASIDALFSLFKQSPGDTSNIFTTTFNSLTYVQLPTEVPPRGGQDKQRVP